MPDEADGGKDEDQARAADEDPLVALFGDEPEDDVPAPETGLHALGQLGTAVLVVSALVVILLGTAIALGFLFH